MRKHASGNSQELIRNAVNRENAKLRTPARPSLVRYAAGACLVLLAWCPVGRAQANSAAPASAEEVKQLREVVQSLLTRVTELESELKQRQSPSSAGITNSALVTSGGPSDGAEAAMTSPANTSSARGETTTSTAIGPAQNAAVEPPKAQINAADRGILDYLHGATLNFAVDEYYEYNFNDPVGRVNALRAYDVLSNNISLNQADLVFERAPDVDAGRPFGLRLDLQYGQATDTLQGNPANEPRQALKETTVSFDYKLSDGFLFGMSGEGNFRISRHFLRISMVCLARNSRRLESGLFGGWGGRKGRGRGKAR